MEKMDNFYNLLDIPYSASNKQIIMGYQNKISKYTYLKKISYEQVKEIKVLKTAVYILTNDNLKNSYNMLLKNQQYDDTDSMYINKNPILQHEQENNEPSQTKFDKLNSTLQYVQENIPEPMGNMMEDTLDSVFNVDNSWMKNDNATITNKKARVDTNLLGDRVFSMPNYGKKQNYSSDIDAELRTPIQCREDKTKSAE